MGIQWRLKLGTSRFEPVTSGSAKRLQPDGYDTLGYCRTHSVRVCLYIAYVACGSSSLYITTLYFFLYFGAVSGHYRRYDIKISYDAKTLQFAIFETRDICVFYSIWTDSSLLKKYSKHFQ